MRVVQSVQAATAPRRDPDVSFLLGCVGPLAGVVSLVQFRRQGVPTGDAVMKPMFVGALASMPALVLLGAALVI